MWSQIFGVGALDGAAFTKLVAREGVKRGVLVAPDIDPDGMQIVDVNGFRLNLTNMHHEFLRLPRRHRLPFVREHVLDVMSAVEIASTWAEAKLQIVPVIRHASYLVHTQLSTSIASNNLVPLLPCRAIAPHLYVTLVVDQPSRMLMVDTMGSWN